MSDHTENADGLASSLMPLPDRVAAALMTPGHDDDLKALENLKEALEQATESLRALTELLTRR